MPMDLWVLHVLHPRCRLTGALCRHPRNLLTLNCASTSALQHVRRSPQSVYRKWVANPNLSPPAVIPTVMPTPPVMIPVSIGAAFPIDRTIKTGPIAWPRAPPRPPTRSAIHDGRFRYANTDADMHRRVCGCGGCGKYRAYG